MPVGGVLVFTRDGDVLAFTDVEEVAGWVEGVDVEDGEYEAFFSVDGRLLKPVVHRHGSVTLIESGEENLAGLRRELRRLQNRNKYLSDPDDPRAVANELLRGEWAVRWPRRPAWLDHRLHGEGPPQV